MSETGHSLKGPHFVITPEGDLHGQDTPENRDVVRRIHACVNACDGISTEELEAGVVQDMRRIIAQVAPLLEDKNQTAKQQQPAKIVIKNRSATVSTS